MSNAADKSLLEALLDSWDRNNTILLNLLRAIPIGGLESRAMEGSHANRSGKNRGIDDPPDVIINVRESTIIVSHDRASAQEFQDRS